jgi:hypothetical protein
MNTASLVLICNVEFSHFTALLRIGLWGFSTFQLELTTEVVVFGQIVEDID